MARCLFNGRFEGFTYNENVTYIRLIIAFAIAVPLPLHIVPKK
jgi:hypothetical protein